MGKDEGCWREEKDRESISIVTLFIKVLFKRKLSILFKVFQKPFKLFGSIDCTLCLYFVSGDDFVCFVIAILNVFVTKIAS